VQTIKSPTRTTSHSETLIDVIYSNKPEILMSTNVLLCSLSDHDAIYYTRKMNNKKKPFHVEIIQTTLIQTTQLKLSVTIYKIPTSLQFTLKKIWTNRGTF